MQSYALISSASISHPEFVGFLRTIGALPNTAPPDVAVYDGILANVTGCVWVKLDDGPLDLWRYRDEDAQERARIEAKLGSQAHTYILLDVSREHGSRGLALHLVTAFVQR